MTETPPVIAGDWTDDDAEYVDNLIESMPHPPAPGELPRESDPAPSDPRARGADRLQGRSGTYTDALAAPILVLPADPDREVLTVYMSGVAGYISDRRDNLFSPSVCVFIPVNTLVTIPNYTGPVYAYPVVGVGGNSWTYAIGAVTR